MPPRERAREGASDELRVELERIDLAVGDPDRPRHRLGGLVLVDRLGVTARILELERGEHLDGRELGAPERAATAARGLVAEEPRALDVLAGERGALRVVGQEPLLLQETCDVLEGEVGRAEGSGHRAGVYPDPAGLRRSGTSVVWDAARPGGLDAQPTGPQDGAGPPPPPPPPPRVAAGRDIWRETSGLAQPGQRTSASSDRRRTSSSKVFPQGAQAYSLIGMASVRAGARREDSARALSGGDLPASLARGARRGPRPRGRRRQVGGRRAHQPLPLAAVEADRVAEHLQRLGAPLRRRHEHLLVLERLVVLEEALQLAQPVGGSSETSE